MTAIDIYVKDQDETYFIGSAVPPSNNESIDDLWAEWREAEPEPNCDSDFVVWLIDEKGWTDALARNSYTIVI